jgi:hypothetical protein
MASASTAHPEKCFSWENEKSKFLMNAKNVEISFSAMPF